MPITPGGRFSPGDTDEWDLTTDLAAMQVSNETASQTEIANALNTQSASFIGTEAERAALTAPKLRNGITFRTTDTNITYYRTGGAWRIAPGTTLGVYEYFSGSNIGGATGTLVGNLVSSAVSVPVGQRVRAIASYSQYNNSGTANSNFTLLQMRNSASPITYNDFDVRVGARGWSSVSSGVHDSVTPIAMLTATVNAPVSAAVYLGSSTTSVYGSDRFTLILEAM
ncbi:hypothetical protein SEA_JACKO_57 [Microbacterium phage Jacko]|nr:hypothetical protein SEA_JACKO_57 [Microbacterium phage Jacko]